MKICRYQGLLSNQRGVVSILVVISMIILLGFAGLAVDWGSINALQNQLQSTADAAALAALSELDNAIAAQAIAISYAETNMPTATHGMVLAPSDVSLGQWDRQTRTFSPGGPSPNAAQVITRRADVNGNPASLYLARVLGRATMDVVVDAIAVRRNPICVLALDPTGGGGDDDDDGGGSGVNAIRLDSNAAIDAHDCEVQVNSTSGSAISAQSNSTVTASAIKVTGGYSGNGYTPSPETGSPPISDPLESLPPPSFSGCDFTNTVHDSVTVTLLPGVYCGGIEINGNAVATFSPGLYIIKDANFYVDSNSIISGVGVSFYLTNGALIQFNSNTQVSFSAMTTGALAGIIFFQDRNDGGTHIFDSNTIGLLEGTIYLPNGIMSGDSNSQIGGASNWSIYIALRFDFDSNSGLQVNSDYETSAVPVPVGLAGGDSVVQ